MQSTKKKPRVVSMQRATKLGRVAVEDDPASSSQQLFVFAVQLFSKFVLIFLQNARATGGEFA